MSDIGFHVGDHWFFKRGPAGSVVIQHRILGGDHTIIEEGSWNSIVAFVSAKGDTAEQFALAQALHKGEEMVTKAQFVEQLRPIVESRRGS